MRMKLPKPIPTALTLGSSLLITPSCGALDNEPIGILSDNAVKAEHRLPDFSYAGYNHGIGDIPTIKGKVIDVTNHGVIADDEIDDSLAMLKAFDVAHDTPGSVVLKLPAGKVIISEILRITRGDIVLRGAGSGPNGTDLYFPRPLQMIDKSDKLDELRSYLKKYDKRQKEKDRNINELFSEYSWSGGFIWIQKDGTRAASYLESEDPEIIVLTEALDGDAGTQTVTVSDSKDLKVGDVVELQWLNRQGEDGLLLQEMYGETELKIGSHHWTFKERPLVRQKTKILGINGTEITISDPLLHEISAKVPAQFANWDHIENVGIEDLSISFPNSP